MAAPTETTPLNSHADNFNWMPIPQSLVPGCPAGLEYLTQIDRLLVSRFREAIFQSTRMYRVRNAQGQDVFYIEEGLNTCSCDSYSLSVTDGYQRQVAQFVASNSAGCCGFGSASKDMDVEAPPGTFIGSIHQDYAFAFQQWFSVMDANGQTALKITASEGNFFLSNVDFKILSNDGKQEVGMISRQLPGLIDAFFSFESRHSFGITFPKDLDVKLKAILILAALIIDRYYFERTK